MWQQGLVLMFCIYSGVTPAVGATGPQPIHLPDQERAEATLAQVDVSLEGPPEDLAALAASDIVLSIAGREIPRVILDRLCGSQNANAADPSPAAVHPSIVFYFDQVHLTMVGRSRSIAIAREMVDRLVTGGARAMIVSSSRATKTVAPMTADRQRLQAGLRILESDLSQFEAAVSEGESNRVAEIIRLLKDCRTEAARALARQYAEEEYWRARTSVERLASVIASLANHRPPKAVIYFADTLREKAGIHYLAVAGIPELSPMAPDASFDFERLRLSAAAQGVHVFTVEGQGLSTGMAQRLQDAEDTLMSLAHSTGGEGLTGGVSVSRMLRTISDRMSCVYVLSFDPRGLPQDRSLSVEVKVNRHGLRAHYQDHIVIQSDEARRTARLLAAFVSGTGDEENDLTLGVIPLGVRDGKIHARIQIRAPGVDVPGARWDLGASLLDGGSVRDQFSARLAVAESNTPVVLERDVDFTPGPFEVVAVANLLQEDRIASRRFESRWPDPKKATAIGPIAIVQEAHAGFSLGGETRTSGSIALSSKDLVDPSIPAAFLAVVCGSRAEDVTLRVDRAAAGTERVSFEPLELRGGREPCASIRDVVKPTTLGQGHFVYEIAIRQGDEEVARARREFDVGAAPVAKTASQVLTAKPE